MQSSLQSLSRDEKVEFLALSDEIARRKRYNASKHFKPYKKQLAFMSCLLPERCLGAGNQLGKTMCGATEAAYHATGLYPDWWRGERFTEANIGWVCGVTGDVVRDTTQKMLIGRIQRGDDEIGTGALPRHTIIQPMVKARGTPDLLDHVKVRHITGGVSIIYFKSYASGREKFQGETIDWIWFDEEPPMDIYSEGRTRTNKGQHGQKVMLTFTPLLGLTMLAQQFYKSPNEHQRLFMMTIDDVGHYSAAEKQKIINSYPEYEREARANGVPVLGSGRVFQLTEASISEPHIIHPDPSWALLNAIDFGYDHPQAVGQIAWDRDNDIIHLMRAAKERKMKPNDMYVRCKPWAAGVPTAWPHDGLQHDKGSCEELASQYRGAGFDMLYEHATHEAGGYGVEAGLIEMQDRFETGRLKIDESLECFWEEYRLYHRKDGKLVKLNDDVISMLRYAIMMKRKAKTKVTEVFELEFASDMP